MSLPNYTILITYLLTIWKKFYNVICREPFKCTACMAVFSRCSQSYDVIRSCRRRHQYQQQQQRDDVTDLAGCGHRHVPDQPRSDLYIFITPTLFACPSLNAACRTLLLLRDSRWSADNYWQHISDLSDSRDWVGFGHMSVSQSVNQSKLH